MTYILYALGASCVVNLILVYLVGKVVVRNSAIIRKQNQREEEETGLIEP